MTPSSSSTQPTHLHCTVMYTSQYDRRWACQKDLQMSLRSVIKLVFDPWFAIIWWLDHVINLSLIISSINHHETCSPFPIHVSEQPSSTGSKRNGEIHCIWGSIDEGSWQNLSIHHITPKALKWDSWILKRHWVVLSNIVWKAATVTFFWIIEE